MYKTNTAIERRQVTIKPDWSVLHLPNPPNEHSCCESCGLPASAAGKYYGIPDHRGWACSISCVECVLFGAGRCHWCSDRLESRAQRYCGDACRKWSGAIPFGKGQRLLNYLARRNPVLFERVSGGSGRRCASCGEPLIDRRSDAVTCGDKCRKALRRLEQRKKAEIARTRVSEISNLQVSNR